MRKYLDFLTACGFEISNNKDGSLKIRHEDGASLDGVYYTDLELFIKELDDSWFEDAGFYGVNRVLLLDRNIKTLDECYVK